MIQLFLFYIFICLVEAAFEASKGDKRHWPSLLASVLISAGVTYWQMPELSIYTALGFGFAYLAIRFWFDYMYNFFKGQKLSYVGTVSKTDLIWARISENKRVWIRIVISFCLYFLAIHFWDKIEDMQLHVFTTIAVVVLVAAFLHFKKKK